MKRELAKSNRIASLDEQASRTHHGRREGRNPTRDGMIRNLPTGHNHAFSSIRPVWWCLGLSWMHLGGLRRPGKECNSTRGDKAKPNFWPASLFCDLRAMPEVLRVGCGVCLWGCCG